MISVKLSAGGRPGTIHEHVYLGAGVDQELTTHLCPHHGRTVPHGSPKVMSAGDAPPACLSGNV